MVEAGAVYHCLLLIPGSTISLFPNPSSFGFPAVFPGPAPARPLLFAASAFHWHSDALSPTALDSGPAGPMHISYPSFFRFFLKSPACLFPSAIGFIIGRNKQLAIAFGSRNSVRFSVGDWAYHMCSCARHEGLR